MNPKTKSEPHSKTADSNAASEAEAEGDGNGHLGRSCSLLAVGAYVPERILSNGELEAMVETSDEWITTRTGIKERRIAADGEFTSDMGAKAAMQALDKAGVSPTEIDLIIVATITPDMPFPATACILQEKIGARQAVGFDLEAACSGFIYALEVGQQFIRSGTYNHVLIVGAEKLSSIVDWTDRTTCVLFGDGAGAAVLGHRPGARGVLDIRIGSDGSKGDLLSMPGGGSRCPATVESVNKRMHYLRMDGKETFKRAVTAMTRAAKESLKRAKVHIDDIQCIIPHQANQRIIDAVGERLHTDLSKVFVNVDKYGNTSAASVAIALAEAEAAGKIRRGDLVLLIAFGAGLTWGAAVIEW